MSVRLATIDGEPVRRGVHRCRVVDLTPELLMIAFSMQQDLDSSVSAARAIIFPGLSFAVIDGGVLVAALGIMPVCHGKAMGWMFPSPIATRRQMVFAVRQARAHFDRWQQDPRFRRIEVYIRDDQPWRASFARALGMTEAFGPMRAFDERGRDFWVYARVA